MAQSPPRNGRIRAITRWGIPILHQPVHDMSSTDFHALEFESLVDDMFATMYAAEGAGLAANQVGVDLKVFVHDVQVGSTRSWGVVCNPVIEVSDDAPADQNDAAKNETDSRRPPPRRMQSVVEGCLSYPGVLASVRRPFAITLRGTDQGGRPLELQAQGQLAQILQHETDHLNGIVYGDHVPQNVRDMMDLQFQAQQATAAYPENWPVTKIKHEWKVCKGNV